MTHTDDSYMMSQIHLATEFCHPFKDKAEMIIIYLSEAHPTDGWQIIKSDQPKVVQHETMADRLDAVQIFLDITSTKTTAPVYVDQMDNAIEGVFMAHPERLVIIDGDQIAFIGGVGPFDYSVEKTESALIEFLEKKRQ